MLPALPGFARVSAIPNCLAPHKRWTGRVPALISLERAVGAVCDLARVPRMLRGGGVLWLNGIKIPREFWGCLRLVDGDELEFIIRPFGGGGFFNSLLKIVGAVVGIALTIWAPFGATGFWAGFGNALLSLGTTVGISLLANLIAPVRPPSLSRPSLDQRSASPTYSLNASSNSMSFGAPVRKVYGRHLVPLTRIVDDYTELIGADEYFYFLGVVGFGPLSMEGMQLGDTALDLYQDVSIQICNGRPGDAVPDILPTVVYQTPLSIQLLTSDSVGKRPERMRDFFTRWEPYRKVTNVWLGVTVCNQAEADEKIPVLLQTPAAVRFVSVEPCLGPVDLGHLSWTDIIGSTAEKNALTGKTWIQGNCGESSQTLQGNRLDWVICGGETGPGARPMHPDWVRSLRDQCQSAGVPFFFKGWGEWAPIGWVHADSKFDLPHIVISQDGRVVQSRKDLAPSHNSELRRVGKRRAGRLLDGRTCDEFPEGGRAYAN